MLLLRGGRSIQDQKERCYQRHNSMTKKVGIPFEKGVSGNPSGRPKTPRDVLEARQMTTVEFTRLMNKFTGMTRDELAEYSRNPKATTLELLVASIIVKAITNGDHMRAEFLLNRLVGKVADQVNAQAMIKLIVEDYTKHKE